MPLRVRRVALMRKLKEFRIWFALSPVKISRSFTICDAFEPERLLGVSNITVAWFIFNLMARSSLLFTRRTGPLAGKNVILFGSEASRSRNRTVKAYSPRFKPVAIPLCSICLCLSYTRS